MKKFLGLVLAGAICFAVTAKASAADEYLGPKFKVSIGGVSVSDLNKVSNGVANMKTSGFGGGFDYSVMPSEKNDVRLNLKYYTSSDWTAYTYGANYVWKFGTPEGMKTGAASTAFYAGLGIDGLNVKAKGSFGGGSASWYGGDIVAGVDISKSFNIELKYTVTNSKNQGGGVNLKGSNFQYTVGYNF